MKILLLTATEMEIKPLLKEFAFLKNKVDVLITGPGMISTVYHLTKRFDELKYDLAINAGIAGSFSKKITLGSVVEVKEECFSELGAENDKNFIHISGMKFKGKDDFPLKKKYLINKTKIKSKTLSELPKVKGITVNTVHGYRLSIEKIKRLFNPQIETMEGAAFFYVCEKEKIPFVQVRAISNYVEKRDKTKWKTDEAINNLCKTLRGVLEEMS
ncbi:MAG TPA: futalosine hydrolase [Bacteroidia bacterium]|nr:futalosine hydrolase [Bacteroidia bacterium]